MPLAKHYSIFLSYLAVVLVKLPENILLCSCEHDCGFFFTPPPPLAFKRDVFPHSVILLPNKQIHSGLLIW